MRYFYDTEFIEDGRTIELISIGVVAEDGREYYAVSTEFDPERAGSWVRANVLPKLPPPASQLWRSRSQIRADLEKFFGVFSVDAQLDLDVHPAPPPEGVGGVLTDSISLQ